MRSFLTSLTVCGAVATMGISTPASAQYYPQYGDPYAPGVVGRVLNDVLGNGYSYGYGPNSQYIVNECTRAVQSRLGGYDYGYGYGYGGGRVLGISSVSPRADGGIAVRGTALTGGYGRAEVAWRCRTDGRGFIKEVAINPSESRYGYGYAPYDYSPYGYHRY